MIFWPFWLGGLALAGVALAHYFAFGAQLGVSGRMTVLVNVVRDRFVLGSAPSASDEDLAEALRAMTAAEFGEAALDVPDAIEPDGAAAGGPSSPPRTAFEPYHHVLFFAGLALGGFASAYAAGTLALTSTLHGADFAAFMGSKPRAFGSLFVGGVLVGFGTRMAGGCTSGHGLIGVSRLSKASIVATMSFFGAGIAFSLLMEAIR